MPSGTPNPDRQLEIRNRSKEAYLLWLEDVDLVHHKDVGEGLEHIYEVRDATLKMWQWSEDTTSESQRRNHNVVLMEPRS
ncbi:hypothetical protein JHK82_032233 [Glycine max]|nr:hypothetical protein JHK82_032233 [Glycine max]